MTDRYPEVRDRLIKVLAHNVMRINDITREMRIGYYKLKDFMDGKEVSRMQFNKIEYWVIQKEREIK